MYLLILPYVLHRGGCWALCLGWHKFNKVETSDNPYTISSTPDDLFIISDALDNVLFSIGRDGTVRGSFDLSNIDLNIESTSEVGGDTILAISDKSGNMLASLNKKEWYFTKIIADEVVTPFGSSSESSDEVIEQTEIAIPELSFYRIDFTMVASRLPI